MNDFQLKWPYDLTKGETEEDRAFIYVAQRICSTDDQDERARLAVAFLIDNQNIYYNYIPYYTIITFLNNPMSVPLRIARNLFLIDRSIPQLFNKTRGVRYDAIYTERLKIFVNNFILETVITNVSNFELIDAPTHQALYMGKGANKADFIGFNMFETDKKSRVFYELKSSFYDDVTKIISYFKGLYNKHDYTLHNTKYLIVACRKLKQFIVINLEDGCWQDLSAVFDIEWPVLFN